MAFVSAGPRNQRVSFERRVAGQNSLGESSQDWELVGTPLWASVLPVGGKEFFAQGQVRASTTLRVLVLPPSFGVDESMRLVWRGLPYVVQAINPPGSVTRLLEVMAVTGVPDEQ